MLEIYWPQLLDFQDASMERVRMHQLVTPELCFLVPQKRKVVADQIRNYDNV